MVTFPPRSSLSSVSDVSKTADKDVKEGETATGQQQQQATGGGNIHVYVARTCTYCRMVSFTFCRSHIFVQWVG